MLTAGIDVGSAFTKAVVLTDGVPLGRRIVPVDYERPERMHDALDGILGEHGAALRDLAAVVACGIGRRSVTLAAKTISEVTAAARGVRALCPDARSVVDAGAHGVRAVALDSRGMVAKFIINDKCASGTGCFLDLMAEALGVETSEVGTLALCSNQPEGIGLTCTAFAESQVVSLVAQGKKREDILAGLVRAVAERVQVMLKQASAHPPVVFAGGVAKNRAVRQALGAALGQSVVVPDDPEFVGALGAALLARDLHAGGK